MQTLVWIAVGSALGGSARYGLSGAVDRAFGETFPWGTWLVNVSGCFVIGLFAALTSPDGRWFVPTAGRQFVMIGFLGGYTTFSSFALQTLNLAHVGETGRAGFYVVLTLAGCLAAVFAGDACASALNRPGGG